MMKIAIIDYEVGNLANVYNAWKRLGIEAVITRDPAVIRDADMVELPGVGAIRDAMGNLQKFDLIPLLQEQVQSGKFFMGVCLGMQALFEKSYEGGTYDCLGFLPGDIVPFHTKLKVPHMGWNSLELTRGDPIFRYFRNGEYVYYVHSFYAKNCAASTLGTSQYGNVSVTGVVRRGNVYGTQFHPEKSGDAGLRLLRAFGEL